MKREYTIGASVTSEEYKELKQYIFDKFMENDEKISMSDLIRDAVFAYVRNGKPDNKQDPTKDAKQDAEQPAKNPFADINF